MLQANRLQRRIEFLVHRYPRTAAVMVGRVAEVLNVIDDHHREPAADALVQVPAIGGLLQQIVLRAPDRVPALEAYMHAILGAYPLDPDPEDDR